MLSHVEDGSQYTGYSSHLHAKAPLYTWRARECVRPLCLYVLHMHLTAGVTAVLESDIIRALDTACATQLPAE